MSKRRLKTAAIAASTTGVNADNFIKFCNTLEGWVGVPLDEDPLKSDVPSPAMPEPEIDWSRPQLVKSKKFEATGDWTFVVKTTGAHTEDYFYGVAQYSDESQVWKKNDFTYHGEISFEPKTSSIEELAKETILQCKDSCYSGWGRNADNKSEGDYGLWSDWEALLVKFGKDVLAISEKIPAGPKTTGLNFIEAMDAVFSGSRIRRPTWVSAASYYAKDGAVFLSTGNSETRQQIIKSEVFATDWQILPK